MSYHLLIHRETFTTKSSTGTIYFNGSRFSYSLEDAKRGCGIKIPAETCLPDGTYMVDVTMSNRFGREMPIIYNQPNGYEIIAEGNSWKGCRIHGGNTHLNTEGCPLTAEHKQDDDTIYGSKEKDLTALLIKHGKKGFITITSRQVLFP